jgi:hypothetical protein
VSRVSFWRPQFKRYRSNTRLEAQFSCSAAFPRPPTGRPHGAARPVPHLAREFTPDPGSGRSPRGATTLAQVRFDLPNIVGKSPAPASADNSPAKRRERRFGSTPRGRRRPDRSGAGFARFAAGPPTGVAARIGFKCLGMAAVRAALGIGDAGGFPARWSGGRSPVAGRAAPTFGLQRFVASSLAASCRPRGQSGALGLDHSGRPPADRLKPSAWRAPQRQSAPKVSASRGIPVGRSFKHLPVEGGRAMNSASRERLSHGIFAVNFRQA